MYGSCVEPSIKCSGTYDKILSLFTEVEETLVGGKRSPWIGLNVEKSLDSRGRTKFNILTISIQSSRLRWGFVGRYRKFLHVVAIDCNEKLDATNHYQR